jgi:hypothetical protein
MTGMVSVIIRARSTTPSLWATLDLLGADEPRRPGQWLDDKDGPWTPTDAGCGRAPQQPMPDLIVFARPDRLHGYYPATPRTPPSITTGSILCLGTKNRAGGSFDLPTRLTRPRSRFATEEGDAGWQEDRRGFDIAIARALSSGSSWRPRDPSDRRWRIVSHSRAVRDQAWVTMLWHGSPARARSGAVDGHLRAHGVMLCALSTSFPDILILTPRRSTYLDGPATDHRRPSAPSRGASAASRVRSHGATPRLEPCR